MSSTNESVREAITRMTQLVTEGERLLAVFREAPNQDLQASQAPPRPHPASSDQADTSASGRASGSTSITDSLRTLFPTFQNSRAGNR